jgi:hypothetical protein
MRSHSYVWTMMLRSVALGGILTPLYIESICFFRVLVFSEDNEFDMVSYEDGELREFRCFIFWVLVVVLVRISIWLC